MLKIKDAKPLYTGLFVTADKYKEDEADEYGIIKYFKGDLKEYQKVFRVGPYVKNVKEGDYVKINFGRYTKYKYSENDLRSEMPTKNEKIVVIPDVTINGEKYLHIDENDAIMVITDSEEVDMPGIELLENHGLIL